MSRHSMLAVLAAMALGCSAGPAAAQGSALAERVARAGDGQVHFAFAARDGVCGNGRSYTAFGTHTHISDDRGLADCQRGPVHVVVARAERAVVALRVAVGGATPSGVTSLGTVPAPDAAEYLLSLAATLDGRPSRDAIAPAVFADSAEPARALLAIAGDRARPLETRRSALAWLSRFGGADAAESIGRLARDLDERRDLRRQAVATLASAPAGVGVPTLLALARAAGDDWLVGEALGSLGRTGDPRARAHLRELVRRADAPEPRLVSAARGLAGEYATGEDATLLRGLYGRVASDSARRVVLDAVARIGGAENERWLLGIARDPAERTALRRAAVSHLGRSPDPRMRDALRDLLER